MREINAELKGVTVSQASATISKEWEKGPADISRRSYGQSEDYQTTQKL